MKAMVLTGYGDVDRYEYRDVPTPEPGAGEVLVAVEACSVNNTEINARNGWYSETQKDSGFTFPRIQGADIAGRVVEVGQGVDSSRIGEMVVIDPGLRWEVQPAPDRTRRSGFLGFDVDGGFAEFVRVPAANAWKAPDTVPAAELACLPVTYTTALEMVLRAQLLPGDTVVVTGASGGVGVALVQLAKLRHVHVIAVASASKAARLRDVGADAVISREDGPVVDSIRAAGYKHIDVVLDVVGGQILGSLLALVRARGRILTAGAISDPIANVDLRYLIYKDISLLGVARNPDSTFAALLSLAGQHLIRPVIGNTFALSELAAAQRAFLAREHIGKISILVE